ncbi:hypothetical protein JYT74_00440 [Crocinitomix catalasitica]|nr:hypothetical protein [Crocinitomix catalasitica]
MNDIDKSRGYLEIRIGKKYKDRNDNKAIKESKPGIINYSYFYGIPILTLKIEKDEKNFVTSIEFVFDHKNLLENHKKNCEDLIEILGEPSHVKIQDKDAEETVRYWIGRKVNLMSVEKKTTEFKAEMLSLMIQGK